MPRSLTPRGLRALQAQTENAAVLSLVTITHAPTNTALRGVDNITPITSRGRVFSPYAYSFTLGRDSLDQQSWVEFNLDNVDQRLVDMLRAAATPPVLDIEIVISDTPDVTELEFPSLILREVTWNATTISAKCMVEDVYSQAFPSRHARYDPRQFPGLFT